MNNKNKCLIVDDDEFSLEVISLYMKKKGYDVEFCKDGLEALEICSKQEFSCIFIDWEMPKMNGIDFLERFSHFREGGNTKIVMVTSNNSIEDMNRAIELGSDGYLVKPFLSDHVTNKLQDIGIN